MGGQKEKLKNRWKERTKMRLTLGAAALAAARPPSLLLFIRLKLCAGGGGKEKRVCMLQVFCLLYHHGHRFKHRVDC